MDRPYGVYSIHNFIWEIPQKGRIKKWKRRAHEDVNIVVVIMLLA